MPKPFSSEAQERKKSIFEHPFLGRGFRPFFLLGAFHAAIMIILWGWSYAGYTAEPASIPWHMQEMIYGYTMAIVAGFLLTAVANWTGGAPARQVHLLALCLVWIAGRIVMNFNFGQPVWLIYVVSLSFIPFLVMSLSIPLFRSWNKRNFVFLGVLSVLSASQSAFLVFEIYAAIYVSLMMIMVMISLIGGRIIPAFTVAALRRRGENAFQTPQMSLDIAALVSLVVTALCLVNLPDSIFLCVAAFVSATIHGLRMRHYHSLRTFSDPMLWILHIGFLWLVIGLVLMGLSGIGMVPLSIALHALTVGAIGSMTLGMMVRVSLGHTGRDLVATKLTTVSFVLMQCAVVMRVFGALFFPDFMFYWIVGSSVLWSVCFIMFVIIYAPVLIRARPDGRAA